MRISENSRWNMKKTILSDLYGLHLDRLDKDKEVFLRKNLVLEYAPYTEYIAKIPDAHKLFVLQQLRPLYI